MVRPRLSRKSGYRFSETDLRKPDAPVAQLDRASDFESEGREFESLRARHSSDSEIEVFSVAAEIPQTKESV